ncbi:thiamine pyrophosphokinase [Mucilaginibacter myungsuensis]|uniref:Thiamine pyrophosphokinase n=1 Tax=Mucilaginibacter myungsuensis TaxID=649104 RepID=A0A929L1N0_9SPHI|nr:thiamine pyrophosphokinase [Mucilaginibacter myungsuensis]MBE9661606.1 thiamine pyrophosphokinase [Mucilaginibacter myungsuensis]MDN3597751.1 thiamine pyrophosphokinase [Mucilaginibacter myungsuensis]
MSSHHIVREKQEPALLIAGLDTFDDELLGQLLEWSPTVICTADTMDKMLSLGIKVDWYVGYKDELPELLDIKVIAPGEDAVTTALTNLSSEGYPSVNIITDELELDKYAKFTGRMDVIIFCGDIKVIAIRSGFSKWKPAGDRLKFLTLPHNFLYTGLTPVKENVYRTTHDGFYSLQFSDKFIFVAEYL